MSREEVLKLWNETKAEQPYSPLKVDAHEANHLNELVVAFAEKLTA